MYIYIYIHTYIHTYIHRERERDVFDGALKGGGAAPGPGGRRESGGRGGEGVEQELSSTSHGFSRVFNRFLEIEVLEIR